MPRRVFRFALLTSSLLLSVVYADSQTCPLIAGCLDPTFGNGGKVLAQIDSTDPAWVQDMVAQSDGKIVAFVETADVGGYKLFRLNADGSFDSSFGTDGIVTFNWTLTLSNGSSYPSMVKSVAIQNVGGQERIVIAGWAYIPSGKSALMALRLNRFLPDGTLDGSFGNNGTVTSGGNAGGIAIQPTDQKIVTVGDRIGGLVRFNANGSLDTTFGTGGKVGVPDGYYKIAFDSAGGVLLSGRESFGKGKNLTQRMTVRRYRANGTLDTTFGTSGIASASFGYLSAGTGIAVDAAGNIVVSGIARAVNAAGTANFGVARFTSTGQPDISFAGTGKAVFDFFGHDDVPVNVFVQASGKIIVAGRASATATEVDFGAVRLNNDGSLDLNFAGGGKMVTGVYGADTSMASVLYFDILCACQKLVISGGSPPFTTFARFTTLPY